MANRGSELDDADHDPLPRRGPIDRRRAARVLHVDLVHGRQGSSTRIEGSGATCVAPSLSNGTARRSVDVAVDVVRHDVEHTHWFALFGLDRGETGR